MATQYHNLRPFLFPDYRSASDYSRCINIDIENMTQFDRCAKYPAAADHRLVQYMLTDPDFQRFAHAKKYSHFTAKTLWAEKDLVKTICLILGCDGLEGYRNKHDLEVKPMVEEILCNHVAKKWREGLYKKSLDCMSSPLLAPGIPLMGFRSSRKIDGFALQKLATTDHSSVRGQFSGAFIPKLSGASGAQFSGAITIVRSLNAFNNECPRLSTTTGTATLLS